jgi:hypothetical protein
VKAPLPINLLLHPAPPDLNSSDLSRFERQADLVRLLVARLERLSADSVWARRASGARGALLKALDDLETGVLTPTTAAPADLDRLQLLIDHGFALLTRAGRELIE